jgi:filamentous hemagglutinin
VEGYAVNVAADAQAAANAAARGSYAGGANGIVANAGVDTADAMVARPTWRQSEIDVGNDLGLGYSDQVSYLNGEQVPTGTLGSVRPDWVADDGSMSIEVKNYNIATNQNGLINNVSQQVLQRTKNLPAGMEQQIIIDVRGQVITPDQENAIIQGIVQKSNGAIGPTSIQFKK